MSRRHFLPAVLVGALLLTVCQEPDPDAGGYLYSVEADSAYFRFDSLWVALVDSSGRDTTVLFADRLESQDQLRRIPVKNPPQGEIRLLIRGFQEPDARPVYEEERIFEIGVDSVLSRSIPLDASRGISRPPTLEFLQADTSGRAGDTLSFKARAADSDGNLVAFAWYFNGDSAADFRDTARSPTLELSARWSYGQAGRRQAALEVRDNTGNRVRRNLDVSVLSRGIPSIRFAFADTLVSIRDSLAFAAAVMDSDGVIASYAWDLEGDGTFGQGLVLDKAEDTLRAGRSFRDTGLHQVVLRVVDERRQEIRDTVRVRVVLDPPWAEAGVDIQAMAEDSLTLRGQGGDSLGTVVRYDWKIGDADFLEAPGGVHAFRAAVDSGTVECVLRVTDDDGLTAEDTVRARIVLSDNAYLSLLTVAAGNMSPAFSKDLSAFSLSVPFGSGSLDLKLKPENPRATITVAGSALKPGDSTARVTLEVGSNPIAILVLAPNGRAQRSYTLNATRRRNTDAALASLGVSSGTLEPSFNPDSLVYRLILENRQDTLRFTPGARDAAHARILVDNQAIVSGTATASFPMAVGTDTLFLAVLAHDDTTARNYQVRVTRLPSADAALKTLALSIGELEPVFKPEHMEYRATVANTVTGMAFRPTCNHSRAKVFLQGKEVPAGSFSDTLPLLEGDNTFRLRGVAESGDSGVYQVQVRRRSANADLVSLTVNRGVLAPAFRPADTAYSVSLLEDSLTVTAQANPSVKSVQVALDSPRVVGTSPMTFTLRGGDQRVNVLVMAEEGNTRTYSIRVKRISRDTTLANLAVSLGTLAPSFQSGTQSYTVTLANADSMLSFKAQPTHALAKVWLGGSPVSTDIFSAGQRLEVGNNVLRLKVLAESGDSGNYVVTARRRSANADLAGLSVSRGTLHPAFHPGRVAYADTLASGIDSLALTAVAADASVQSIRIDSLDFPSDSASRTLALKDGAQAFTIAVTAEDGIQKLYRVEAYRKNGNADLASLGFNPSLKFTFSPGVVDYVDTVPYAVSSLAISPVAAHFLASIAINGSPVGSGQGALSVALRPGSNAIVVSVRAEDTAIAKIYRVSIHRERGYVKSFGGTGSEAGSSIQQTRDGGFIVAGSITPPGAEGAEAYLHRIDSLGIAWSGWPKTFGGTGDQIGSSVQQTSDGGFIVAGLTTEMPSSSFTYDSYLIRTDDQGNALPGWPKVIDLEDLDRANSVQQTSDGGFVLAGVWRSPQGVRAYLLRTNSQGVVSPGWPKSHGMAYDTYALSVRQTSDGGFIVAGQSALTGNFINDVFLLRTNSQGDALAGWPRTFGGTGEDRGTSVQQTSDGGFVVAGTTASSGAGGNDVYLIRTDGQGNVLPGWPKTFGGAGNDGGACVQQTADGGFILAGTTASIGSGGSDVYLIRTDGQGNVLPGWPRTFGGSGNDGGNWVQQTSDGGFIVTGYTNSIGAGGTDVYLIKTDPDGNVK